MLYVADTQGIAGFPGVYRRILYVRSEWNIKSTAGGIVKGALVLIEAWPLLGWGRFWF